MTTILLIGTFDTKDDELRYLAQTIQGQGGQVLTMDVSVLGDPTAPCDVSKQDVAGAAGSDIEAVINAGDENQAMQIMARGAAATALRLHQEGRIDAMIGLGGTMGTDLLLDVAAALPVGVPKYVVSTVAFSPLIPAERLAADIQMILWAGGLYGLNSICKAALSQAAGAVLGAARAAEPPQNARPLVGMTSFGKTVLRYMVALKPALEARGFEVAVFHATGMGGRAFESLAGQGAFAAVMDFAPQEVGNYLMGSSLNAGADRMEAAGAQGLPQLVAPGCYDLVDFVGWQPVPQRLDGQEVHAHNRLLSSVAMNIAQREEMAQTLCAKLAKANGPVTFLLPMQGCNEWDRPGAPLSDPEGLTAFCAAMRAHAPPNVDLRALYCHINDPAFPDAALAVFDGWIADGTLPVAGRPADVGPTP